MVWGNISQDLQLRDIVVLVISREILSQCNLIIQIIKNNQMNKINQDKLAHHRTDFGSHPQKLGVGIGNTSLTFLFLKVEYAILNSRSFLGNGSLRLEMGIR